MPNWLASWASTLKDSEPMHRFRLLAIALLLPLMVSCSSSTGAALSQGCANAPAACLQGKALVQMLSLIHI